MNSQRTHAAKHVNKKANRSNKLKNKLKNFLEEHNVDEKEYSILKGI